MKHSVFVLGLVSIFLTSCIGNDIVQDEVSPEIRIMNPVDSIEIGTTYPFSANYFNNVGVEVSVPFTWSSSQPTIISIDNSGLAQAQQLGSSVITVEYDNNGSTVSDFINVGVGNSTVQSPSERTGLIQTTSSYQLMGDFTVKEEGNGIKIDIGSNYRASTALPGLYIYLTNNPNTVANALEIGRVVNFSGAHSYTVQNVGINDYNYLLYFCKPFNVKVGDGAIN